MKITGMGPTTGVQIEPKDEQELEISELVLEEAAPLESAEEGARTSDHHQTQEGLARLYDFLKAKKGRSRSQREKALSAYHKISYGDLDLSGTNLKVRV